MTHHDAPSAAGGDCARLMCWIVLCALPAAALCLPLPPQDCLEQVVGMEPDAALGVLGALWPLCMLQRDLQDHATLVLRKVMFGRDVAAR